MDPLMQQISNLETSANTWNITYLVLLIASFLFTGGTIVAQSMVIGKTKRLAKLQAELIANKDESLKLNLKDKDGQIAHAKAIAATANENTSKAKALAAEANATAASANKATEDERMKRVLLEKQVAPRRLSPIQQETIWLACKRFSGKVIRVRTYALDADGALLAFQVVDILKQAGVSVIDLRSSELPLGGFAMGVHIQGNDADLVNSLAALLQGIGELKVAPPKVTNQSEEGESATILIGIKPPT